MNPVRYALIGCGDMGQVHVMNYLQNPGLVDTVAVCDISDDRLQAVLKLLPDRDRVRVVHDYRAVLDMADVDAVVISTPNNTHCEIVEAAFAAGKHVFWLELMRYDRVSAKHHRETIDANSAVHGFGQIGHSGGFDQHVEFCACICEGRQAFCDGWIGLESLYPAFAAQQSIAEGGRVIEIAELRGDFAPPPPPR